MNSIHEAVKMGNLALLKDLYTRPWDEETCVYAVDGGYLGWDEHACAAAAEHGHTTVLFTRI